MVVKAGYKQTDMGILPEDWEIKLLKKISTLNGRIGWQGLKQDEFTSKDDDPFLITGMNFKDGEIRWQEVYHIPNERYEEAKPIQLHKGDILITKDGTIGKLLYIDNIPYPGKASLNSHLLVFRPINEAYTPNFLFYQLDSTRFARYIDLNKSGTTFFGITQEAIGNYPAYLPNKDEQHTIATTLSDADAQISSLNQVIAKKRDIKQAAMQDLLTGKRRFPGFTEKWEVYAFGEIFTFLNTANYPWSELSETGDVKYIHYGDVHKNPPPTFDSKKNELLFIEKEKVKDITRVLDGDLVMVDAAEDYVGTGKSFEVINVSGQEIVAGLHTLLMRGDNNLIADGLKGYLQYIPEVKSALIKIATGISVYGISQNNVKKIEVTLPTVTEQRAIATVLSDMDAELAALGQKRDKTKAIKQGMMQELLTGRIRLT